MQKCTGVVVCGSGNCVEMHWCGSSWKWQLCRSALVWQFMEVTTVWKCTGVVVRGSGNCAEVHWCGSSWKCTGVVVYGSGNCVEMHWCGSSWKWQLCGSALVW